MARVQTLDDGHPLRTGDYPVDMATVKVAWRPRDGGPRDDVRIEWIERPADHGDATDLATGDSLLPDGFAIAVDLHQEPEPHRDAVDETAHFQIERPDGLPSRAGYDITGETSLRVLADLIAYVVPLVSEIRGELDGERVDRGVVLSVSPV